VSLLNAAVKTFALSVRSQPAYCTAVYRGKAIHKQRILRKVI